MFCIRIRSQLLTICALVLFFSASSLAQELLDITSSSSPKEDTTLVAQDLSAWPVHVDSDEPVVVLVTDQGHVGVSQDQIIITVDSESSEHPTPLPWTDIPLPEVEITYIETEAWTVDTTVQVIGLPQQTATDLPTPTTPVVDSSLRGPGGDVLIENYFSPEENDIRTDPPLPAWDLSSSVSVPPVIITTTFPDAPVIIVEQEVIPPLANILPEQARSLREEQWGSQSIEIWEVPIDLHPWTTLGEVHQRLHEAGGIASVVESDDTLQGVLEELITIGSKSSIKEQVTQTNTVAHTPTIQAEFPQQTRIASKFSHAITLEDITLDTTSNLPKPIERTVVYQAHLGRSSDYLLFSQPVELSFTLPDLETSNPTEILVLHEWDNEFNTHGLTADPDAACLPDGSSTLPSSTPIYREWKLVIYTCAASTFVVTYTGGQNSANFVDGGYTGKTITINTGDVATGFTIDDLNVLVNFWKIDGTNPLSPGPGSARSPEMWLSLTSPAGTTTTLLASWAYTRNNNAPRVTVTFDDAGSALPTDLPVTGTFLPYEALSVFSGENPIGNWTFTFGDTTAGDGLILFWATLQMMSALCGDGAIDSGETCDDANTSNGDWCSSTCAIEAGWTCTGQPSSCSPAPSATWLRVLLDGSQNVSGNFIDVSSSGNTGTQFNGVTTWSTNGETIMCLNGTNQYIEINTGLVSGYPFTMSAWIKTDTVTGLHGIMSLARSSATNRMYNLEHNGTTFRASAQNTTARYANATTSATTSNWFLITAVYSSATSRDIYINGTYEWNNTQNVTFDTSVNRLNIWRLADSSPSNYFDGCVDDVRVYSNGLSSGQIYELYAHPATLTTSFTTSSSPLLTGVLEGTGDRINLIVNGTAYSGTNNGNGTWSLASWSISPALTSGTYSTTLLVTNPYDRTVVYTSAFVAQPPVVSGGTLSISAPLSFIFSGMLESESLVQQLTEQFSGYFAVNDRAWNSSGYYTTIQISDFNGQWLAQTIPNSSFEWSASGISLLSWTANASVSLPSARSSYRVASGVMTFIERPVGSGAGIFGSYGVNPWLRLNIPAYTRADTYLAEITYTLYEN